MFSSNVILTDIYNFVPLEPTDEDLLASAMEVESQGECCVLCAEKINPHFALTCAQLIICDHK